MQPTLTLNGSEGSRSSCSARFFAGIGSLINDSLRVRWHCNVNWLYKPATKKPGHVTLNGSSTQRSGQRIANEESRVSCRARCFIGVSCDQDRWINDTQCLLRMMLVRPIQHDSATLGFSLAKNAAAFTVALAASTEQIIPSRREMIEVSR